MLTISPARARGSLAGQTLFYLCVVTGGAHIVYSRHGGSKEKVEGEEGKESGDTRFWDPCRNVGSTNQIALLLIMVTSLFIVT